MKKLWIRQDIDASAQTLWKLLTVTDYWPEWGLSVRRAELDGGVLAQGSTGTITTLAGLDLSFEVTDFEEGARWAWKVAGIPATDHTVEALGPDLCRVGFGVPWPAAPYLAVCRVALSRLESMALNKNNQKVNL